LRPFCDTVWMVAAKAVEAASAKTATIVGRCRRGREKRCLRLRLPEANSDEGAIMLVACA
jgi:hypothetical protein